VLAGIEKQARRWPGIFRGIAMIETNCRIESKGISLFHQRALPKRSGSARRLLEDASVARLI